MKISYTRKTCLRDPARSRGVVRFAVFGRCFLGRRLPWTSAPRGFLADPSADGILTRSTADD